MHITPVLNFQYRKLQKASQVAFCAANSQNLQEPQKTQNLKEAQKTSSADTFQSSAPRKIFDSEVINALREGKIESLRRQEEKGEIEVNWNAVDIDGDNLPMMYFRRKFNTNWYREMDTISAIKKLADEGKIDINYVNRGKYSLPQCAIMYGGFGLYQLFDLKNLDITKTDSYWNKESIVKLAIRKDIGSSDFEKLVCHPSMDITKYDVKDLYKYIDSAESDDYYNSYRYRDDGRHPLSDYDKRQYKNAIEVAIKVQNARKGAKYYKENGSMTLSQIQAHVNNTCTERAINMPLTDLNGTIAHLLAETYVDPEDKASVQVVKDTITKMRNGTCYFWKEDDLGRSPLMQALEIKNIVVAKAMLEKMTKSELKYYDINELGARPCCSIKESIINHLPVLWNLIADLNPKDRKELGLLLVERSKSRWS